jgi:hypothetical protein
MRCALNRRIFFVKEAVGHPVQLVPCVHTKILIGEDLIALANDKTKKRPVAITNTKLSATRVGELLQPPDLNFRRVSHQRSMARL